MNKRKIVTSYVPPPIPNRGFDWTAIEDGYDEGGLIGFGATEAEAIKDLESQLQEGEAAMADVLIIRKKTDPSVRATVERHDPSEPLLTVERFPWKRIGADAVTYFYGDDWEEATLMIRNRLSYATVLGVSRISTDGPDGPGWVRRTDTVVMYYYEKLGWEVSHE